MKDRYGSLLLSCICLLALILLLPGCASVNDTPAIDSPSFEQAGTTAITPSLSPPAPETTDTALFELEEYAAYYGISVEEARQRFDFSGSFAWLQTELWFQEAGTFAGSWIRHEPEYRLVFRFTRNGEETLKKYIPQEVLERFEVLPADWTLDELRMAQDETGAALQKLGINFESNTDVRKNRAEIHILPEYRTRYEEAVRDGSLAVPENVDIYLLSDPPVSPIPAAVPITPAPPVRAAPPPNSPLPVLDPEDNPLPRLLQFVPGPGDFDLTFYDIPAISFDRRLAVPPPESHPYYKDKWWSAIAEMGPGIVRDDTWEIDPTGIQGVLQVFGPPTLEIIGGHIDTAGMRQKLQEYRYSRETYRGCDVFSADPEAVEGISTGFSMSLPQAVGIIEDVTVGQDSYTVILMVNDIFDKDVSRARETVETAIKTYRDNTSPGFQTGPAAEIARSLGRTGSLFITEDGGFGGFEKRLQETRPENLESLRRAIGPGNLGPYRHLAAAYRGYNFTASVEFVLAYDDPAAARENVEPLRERLTKGRIYGPDMPLTQVWKVQEVRTEGRLLRATVKLTGEEIFYNLSGMIYTLWYLYPGCEGEG